MWTSFCVCCHGAVTRTSDLRWCERAMRSDVSVRARPVRCAASDRQSTANLRRRLRRQQLPRPDATLLRARSTVRGDVSKRFADSETVSPHSRPSSTLLVNEPSSSATVARSRSSRSQATAMSSGVVSSTIAVPATRPPGPRRVDSRSPCTPIQPSWAGSKPPVEGLMGWSTEDATSATVRSSDFADRRTASRAFRRTSCLRNATSG